MRLCVIGTNLGHIGHPNIDQTETDLNVYGWHRQHQRTWYNAQPAYTFRTNVSAGLSFLDSTDQEAAKDRLVFGGI